MFGRTSILAGVLLVAISTGAAQETTVSLRIVGTDLREGLPERIEFVFENSGDAPVRLPPIPLCSGVYTGRVRLRVEVTPSPLHGSGRGCGGGMDHQPSITEQAKHWEIIPPHGSVTVTFSRAALSSEEEDGSYEIWGEYEPPALRPEELLALKDMGLDFVSTPLTSQPLQLVRTTRRK